MAHIMITWILFLTLQHYMFLYTLHKLFNHILFSIYPAGSTTQANQSHLPQSPSHKPPLCPTHIIVQSIPHSKKNKLVQYAYSVELQHLPTFPTSPTLQQEIHTRSRGVIDLGVVETMEEHKVSTWTY